jgi:hypothetical protein
MFLLDSLMIAGIKWALQTTITAAEAEMNDDTVLREELLAAEMRREMGEISDEEFEEIEADLLARIREIKERREGGAGPLAFGGAQPMETGEDGTFQIEASVSGDFYDPHDRPHSTVVDDPPPHGALAHLIETDTEQTTTVMDMAPSLEQPSESPAQPRPASRQRARGKRRAPAKKRPRSRSKLRS